MNKRKVFKKETLHLEFLSLMDNWIGFSFLTSLALPFVNLRLYKSTLYHVVIQRQNNSITKRKYILNNFKYGGPFLSHPFFLFSLQDSFSFFCFEYVLEGCCFLHPVKFLMAPIIPGFIFQNTLK